MFTKRIMVQIKVKITDRKATIPTYATSGSSGFDFYCISETLIPPNTWRMIIPGFNVQVPEGYELQIRSRSGVAIDHGLIVLNQPGTVDSDYRGPLGIVIWNITNIAMTIEEGTRIAQGVICPVVRAEFVEVEELTNTVRGEGGFGSTGKS
jgi:dUTP pyrophosphatase